MKQLFTLAFTVLALSLSAQNQVNLHFEHMMGDQAFQKSEVITAEAGYDLYFTRLQYYISEIELVHDGGQITPVEETWLLVDAAETDVVNLGSFNVEELEGINFSIGVDPDHNHLDPSTYPTDHPLAPQSPSMHWGWASGYRFLCMEGKSGPNQSLIYQVHALGDNNYFETSLTGSFTAADGELNVGLGANYLNLLTNVDVSSGLIEHSEVAEAKTALQNMSLDVFYLTEVVITTSDDEVAELQQISVAPNPATDNILVRMETATSGQVDIRMIDLYGRVLETVTTADQSTELSVSDFASGLYHIQVWQKGQLIAVEKVLVSH